MQTRLKLHLVKVSLFTLGAMVSTSAVLAQAGDAKAIEARQANFKEIDKHWKPVTEMLKRKIPYDAAQVQQAATAIEPLAKKIPETFVPDTRQVTGVKTKARENIWSNQPDFKAKSEELVKALNGLAAAAKTGDEKAFRPAVMAVGKACSACHDNYKDS